MDKHTVVSSSVSLYPSHWRVVEAYAGELGLEGTQTRSQALRRLIAEFQRLRAENARLMRLVPAIVDLSPGALEPFPAPRAAAPDGDTPLIGTTLRRRKPWVEPTVTDLPIPEELIGADEQRIVAQALAEYRARGTPYVQPPLPTVVADGDDEETQPLPVAVVEEA